MFCKKGVLRNFAKSTENTCSRVSFLKKRLWHGCFPVNFYEIFLTEQLRWLLLKNLFTHSISVKTKGESKEIKQKWKRPKYFVNTKMLRYFIIVFPLLSVGFSFKDTGNLQQSVYCFQMLTIIQTFDFKGFI